MDDPAADDDLRRAGRPEPVPAADAARAGAVLDGARRLAGVRCLRGPAGAGAARAPGGAGGVTAPASLPMTRGVPLVLPVPGGGRRLLQPVHVADLAGAVLTAVERPETAGRSYDVAGPEPLTFAE